MKTSPSRAVAELFSLFSSFDDGCHWVWGVHRADIQGMVTVSAFSNDAAGLPIVRSKLEMSAHGTERTSWTGLAMSVDWGRPEAVGGASNRGF